MAAQGLATGGGVGHEGASLAGPGCPRRGRYGRDEVACFRLLIAAACSAIRDPTPSLRGGRRRVVGMRRPVGVVAADGPTGPRVERADTQRIDVIARVHPAAVDAEVEHHPAN